MTEPKKTKESNSKYSDRRSNLLEPITVVCQIYDDTDAVDLDPQGIIDVNTTMPGGINVYDVEGQLPEFGMLPPNLNDGPYTGRAFKRKNGTVFVYRITIGQRRTAETTKQILYATSGWIGVSISLIESMAVLDLEGTALNGSSGFFQFAEGVSWEAAGQEIVGECSGGFEIASKFAKLGGAIISGIQIYNAATDQTISRSEALHCATFNVAESIKMAHINYGNKGLMEFEAGFNPQSIERHMNAIYQVLDCNLLQFDLTTEKGIRQAGKYIDNNINDIIRQVNYLLKYE